MMILVATVSPRTLPPPPPPTYDCLSLTPLEKSPILAIDFINGTLILIQEPTKKIYISLFYPHSRLLMPVSKPPLKNQHPQNKNYFFFPFSKLYVYNATLRFMTDLGLYVHDVEPRQSIRSSKTDAASFRPNTTPLRFV